MIKSSILSNWITQILKNAKGPEAWYTLLVEVNQAYNAWSNRQVWTSVFKFKQFSENDHFWTSEVSDVSEWLKSSNWSSNLSIGPGSTILLSIHLRSLNQITIQSDSIEHIQIRYPISICSMMSNWMVICFGDRKWMLSRIVPPGQCEYVKAK